VSLRPPSAKAVARAATRESLLAAATEILLETPADPIGALRPVEVARRARPPRSNGAFYNIWPTRESFARDLLQHILSADRVSVRRPTRDAGLDTAVQEEFSLDRTVHALADLNFDGLRHDAGLRLKQALWSRHAVDPEVARLIARLYADGTATLAPMYGALLARGGRRMRAPYTLDHLAVTLTALAEGLHMRWSVQPDAVPDDLGPDAVPGDTAPDDADPGWSLFAAAADIVVHGMTEPVVD
jgi:AcrR family transcriptional regulator